MRVQHFFESVTSTLSYLVWDEATLEGVVIDPVMDLELRSARTSWSSCEAIARFAGARGIALRYAIDTHAHADHATGLQFFREACGAKTATGSGIGEIQATFRELYGLPAEFPCDGRQFDRLIGAGDALEVGRLSIEALHTPGHTPAHLSLRVEDALFVGDTLFMPDHGTARCDFPGGSAAQLFDSIARLYELPDATRVFVCHDYQPGGRELRFETTLGEQKRSNVQLNAATVRDEFIAFREQRDRELALPALLLAAMQINIRGGGLPEAETNGTAYLKIPLNRF